MRDQQNRDALLLRPTEASRLLAVSPRKLWSMTFEETPSLPCIRCGRLVRYSIEDLQRWVDLQREGGNHESS